MIAEGGFDVGGVGGVERDGEVVGDLEGDTAGALEFLFVEVVDFCVGYENIVIVDVIVEIDVGLVEGYPDRDAVCEAAHDLLGLVEEGVWKCCSIGLEMQQLVSIGERDDGGDTVRQACVNEIIAVVKAWLVDWRSHIPKWYYPSP